MHPAIAIPATNVSVSKARIWTGRVITALVVLFLVFDGAMKVIKEAHVVAASAELGYSVQSIAIIGAVLLACTALYLIPQTAVLGVVLLTGYLGGAVASQVRIGKPVFDCSFPILFAILAWAGLFLREPRLRDLLPLRKAQ